MSRYICRKEIAAILELHPNTVANNERHWGLMRISGSKRPRYLRKQAFKSLREMGFGCSILEMLD